MSNENKNPNLSDDVISKIDQAIASAQANKAKRTGESPPGPVKPKRPRLTPEARESRDAAREIEKAQKREARELAREVKRVAKEANKVPAHMKKVLKAAENLPPLGDGCNALFNDILQNADLAGIDALAQHLEHVVRLRRTEQALKAELKVAQVVRITGGHPRYLNMTGTVEKVQRIRCYVTVPGLDKPVYLFTSDVAPLTEEDHETVDETSVVRTKAG